MHPNKGDRMNSILRAAKAAPKTHTPSSTPAAAMPPAWEAARSPASHNASSRRYTHANSSASWRAVFASTFTPEYAGLTVSNVNARVSCHEGYQRSLDKVEKL